MERFVELTNVKRSCMTKYMSSKSPTDSMIRNMVKGFLDTGSVANSSRVRLESTHIKHNEAKITIIDIVSKFRNFSIQKLPQAS